MTLNEINEQTASKEIIKAGDTSYFHTSSAPSKKSSNSTNASAARQA